MYKQVSWQYEARDPVDPFTATRMIGLVRFDRADGHDPRVEPEEDGTHVVCKDVYSPMKEGRYSFLAVCGAQGWGFTDFGPITGISCPTCAAFIAADLLEHSKYG